MNKKMKIAVPMAGLAALGIGAVAVQAATPTPSSTSPAQIFVDKLAGILHVTPTVARDDLKKAQEQTIDQMVKDGKITQAQADAMKKRLAANPGPLPAWGFGPGFGAHRPPLDRALAGDLRNAEMNAVAKALKIDAATLQSDLKSGKKLSDLETTAGVTDKAVRDAVYSAAKGVLDQAVKDKKITQDQENAVLQQVQNGRLPVGPAFRGRGFGRPPGGNHA